MTGLISICLIVPTIEFPYVRTSIAIPYGTS